MPIISMFYGIVISMYFSDHMPPHFHAEYQDYEAEFLLTGELLKGNMPERQQRFIRVWADLHYEELAADWKISSRNEHPYKIDPLR